MMRGTPLLENAEGFCSGVRGVGRARGARGGQGDTTI